ncbi:unnamed protein product [Paramecium primaurelia]|uniref:Uncharacterized protein n=1 Tax=Paramecium primaurelia TaxID=5886 RepID=A0A8S1PYG6_PARPR|nr:unnamed protein product [Paramecium primaurelia]
MIKLPENISTLKTSKDKQFKGYWSQSNLAQQYIKSLYPQAEVTSKSQDKITGEMEITVTRKDAKSEKIHSKLGGDGPFGAFSAEKAMKKLVNFIEN